MHSHLLRHHGFGKERRQYQGRELTKAELSFGHGSRVWIFTRKPNVNVVRQRLCTDPDRWTNDAIGGLLPVDPNLRIGAEQKEQKVCESFKGSVMAKLLRGPTRC